jgi:hypothetical protein
VSSPVAPRPVLGGGPVAWLGYLLFFLMLFVPTSYQVVKAPMLVLLVLLVLAGALARGRWRLHPLVLLWTVFLVGVGLLFMVRGLMLGAPGAIRVGTVYVVWPLVYMMLVAGATRWEVLRGLGRTMIASTMAIALYGFSYILHVVGWLPAALFLPVDLGQQIGLYRGFIELNLYNLSSLLFLVPFVVALLMTWSQRGVLLASRTILWIALVMGGALVLLSGRRALLLVVMLSPALVLVFRGGLPAGERRSGQRRLVGAFLGAGVAALCLLVYLNAAYHFSLLSVWRMFLQGFDFGRDVSATARSDQLTALMTNWAGSPLLGAGHGASAAGSVRSVEMPWAYELSYAALLFHTGLVGFLAYSAAVVWIYVEGWRVIQRGGAVASYMLAVLVGLSCFLIGNATNPYLEKYDLMWVIFLPVAVINYGLLARSDPVGPERSGTGVVTAAP